jgi:hypothetical protein
MTTLTDMGAPVPSLATTGASADHRGSWIPTGGMITTRIMELRKRRGLMIALAVVNIGIPSVFLIVRLLSHAIAPKSYGPAGGYDIYTNLVAGVMYVFGFIVAATLGATAGSIDLTDGMFRHLVVTGRSRLALYLARIPAGLAIVWTMLAIGFTIVCAVCVFAAPTSVNYDGATLPAGLSLSGFENWAAAHPRMAICDLPYQGNNPVVGSFQCGPNGPVGPGVSVKGSPPPAAATPPTAAALKAAAIDVAKQDYGGYRAVFLYPSTSLMIRSGLWLGLEATIGFIVGLGLGSLNGQRTVTVVLMIVLEVILTPILSMHVIPHLLNAQRGVVGLATAHLEPAGLPLVFGGGGGGGGPPGAMRLLPESRTVAVCVVVAWLVVWTALGAWRMMTRDA